MLIARLDDVAVRARAAQLEPPTVIVIGQVVALAKRLAWFAPDASEARAYTANG